MNAKDMTIKDWYTKEYPTDELGQLLNPLTTFEEIYEELPLAYELLGVSDSLVRERVFNKLDEIMQVSYDVIYNKWLY